MKLVNALWLLAVTGCTNEENLGNTLFQDRAAWSLALGGRGYEQGNAIAFDAAGDVIVAGTGYEGTIDFGNGPVGTLDEWGFLTKRSGLTGDPIWERSLVGNEHGANVQIFDIAVGSDGSIYTSGAFMGAVDIGGTALATPLHQNGDLFVAKYTADGDAAWVTNFGSLSNAAGMNIAVDSYDNVYVSGMFRVGSFEFLATTYTAGDNQVGFIASYTRDGVRRWIRSFDPTASTSVSGLATSPTGDVVLTGKISSTTAFGTDTLQAESSQAFLARYRADGSYVWARSFGDPTMLIDVLSLSVDSSDRIFVQTATQSTAPGIQESDRVLDVFGPDGGTGTTFSFGTTSSGQTVTSDGTFVSSQWIDTNEPGYLELTQIDPSGTLATSTVSNRLAQSGGAGIRDSAVGPTGELAVIGDLRGEILVGPTAITAHGTNDTDALVILVPPTKN